MVQNKRILLKLTQNQNVLFSELDANCTDTQKRIPRGLFFALNVEKNIL